jgi:cytochrome c biogenesis protein CcdA
VIGALALSILLFTYLLKASTALIAIPQSFWSYFSGAVLIAFGLVFVFPRLWERLPLTAAASTRANRLVGTGYQKQSFWGDALIGFALGPVFSSCSPTYFVILATVLPASFFLGTVYLLAYIAGLVLVLGLIALLGQRLASRLQFAADSRGLLKRGAGVLFIIIGIFIATGYDKKLEAWVLDSGYLGGVLNLEEQLLDDVETRTAPSTPTDDAESDRANTTVPQDDDAATDDTMPSSMIPPVLRESFPNTDFSHANPKLQNALSGGPPKDGIPALDEPRFVPLHEFQRPDNVQAIVLTGETETKVYPYNILVWHEIVNDTIDSTPVAVTFCPLCGSAIVYNRTLPDGTMSTFGVSGTLLESNMIMYDRETENLWQQSTGRTLAGSFHPARLQLEQFQLRTLGDVRTNHPDAVVLSENTGHRRDYSQNPYAGYEMSEQFVFAPSTLDTSFPAKEIMIIFRADDTTFAAPWGALRDVGTADVTHDSNTYRLTVSDSGELAITDDTGEAHPFYFEMWFSAAAQHGDALVVIAV